MLFRLLECIARLEAYIDFSEEENIDVDVLDTVVAHCGTLRRELADAVWQTDAVRPVVDGLQVCIVGRPNVGKSSLMNRLCEL